MMVTPPVQLRRLLLRLLLLLSLLVTYVSLYPFRFRLQAIPFEPMWSAPDMVANLLLFLPFGALVRALALVTADPQLIAPPAKTLPHPERNALALGLLAGAALAAGLQWLQVFVPGRQPALMDVGMNWIGLGLGAALAPARWSGRWQAVGQFWLASRAGWLLLFWLLAQWSPLLPDRPARALARLQAMWRLPFDEIACLILVVAWLLVLALLPASWRTGKRLAFVLLVLLPQPWLLGTTLWPHELLAALVVAVLAMVLARWGPLTSRHWRGLFLLLVLALVLRGVWPLLWLSLPKTFHFWPFEALVHSPVAPALAVLAEKLFWYGGLLEAGRRAGWPARRVLIGVSLGLLALEVTQVWLPGHRAESTDVLLLWLLAGGLALVTPPDQVPAVADARMPGSPLRSG